MTKSFIETQFPVVWLSEESYKERKAVAGQTLTGLGKWWGRKPLVMVRATIFGLLLPATNDPHQDLYTFLRLMTMDEDGLQRRKKESIPLKEKIQFLTEEEFAYYINDDDNRYKFKNNITPEEKNDLEHLVFQRMTYQQKLGYLYRPEEIDGPSEESWSAINHHCETNAYSLQAWVQEIGSKCSKGNVTIGDAFAGGGSVPFEATRLGARAYGNELNPVGALLSWASINIIGGDEHLVDKVREKQNEIIRYLDNTVSNWGIEHNEKDWRADSYLYCTEVKSPSSGYWVPLAPSWVIAEKSSTCAVLHPREDTNQFKIEVITNADKETFNEAKRGTLQSNALIDPITGSRHPIGTLRGDKKISGELRYGLRMWENEDVLPRKTDTFQERLYCIRYIETRYEFKDNYSGANGLIRKGTTLEKQEAEKLTDFDDLIRRRVIKPFYIRHYVEPDENDLERENKVISLLKERFQDWQSKGLIPSEKIPKNGYNTEQPRRERGWTYWHHLFNQRQLLYNGLIRYYTEHLSNNKEEGVSGLLFSARAADWNSRLSVWLPTQGGGIGGNKNTFLNQALNPTFNYGCRGITGYKNISINSIHGKNFKGIGQVTTKDARKLDNTCQFWILDPPYADAINYHEVGYFFLAWYKSYLQTLFPDWHTDPRSALAIKGSDESFNHNLVESLKNIRQNMPDDGAQVLMFTHQDASVWANLALIVWAAGLKVSCAWTIQTETPAGGIKQGTYVQGTVLMMLRKQLDDEVGFLNDIYADVEDEVKKQVDFMRGLDEGGRNVFSDPDYQLAAYASALKVLTQFNEIEGIDVQRELNRPQIDRNATPVKDLIDQALNTATEYLVPRNFPERIWRRLIPKERFYLKGLQLEAGNEYRSGVYEEMARGFGIPEYKFMLNAEANATRLKTPKELGNQHRQNGEFADSFLRELLYAINRTHRDESAKSGRDHLYAELPDYWGMRTLAIEVLNFIYTTTAGLEHWEHEREACNILSGYLENDTPK